MTQYIVVCPNARCRARCRLDESQLGQALSCPNCQTVWRAAPPAPAVLTGAVAPPPVLTGAVSAPGVATGALGEGPPPPTPAAAARDPAPPEWVAGQVLLDEFVVERQLGRGGMGAVYLVRSRSGGRRFAV
jgi:hypothetical protein